MFLKSKNSPAPSTIDAEKRDMLRLIRSENVGPVTFYQLMARFKTAGEAIRELPNLARRGGKSKALKTFSAAEAEDEIAKIQKFGADVISRYDEAYSPLLAAIEDAPPIIIVKGHAHLMQKPSVGIVGARNASAAGRRAAQDFAAALGQAGFTVVSGLARGIDSAAHTGSLSSGTIAVMAGGIDQIYPPENAGLYEQIGEQGLLLSEIEFGESPQARHFPRRNRIVSGLSQGVMVVEAALKSGSLITARFAGEQGREVYAMPGSPSDPRCKGTNSLLKQGAVLVEEAQDIIEDLAKQSPLRQKPANLYEAEIAYDGDMDMDHAKSLICDLLSATPVSVDELIRQANIGTSAVLTVLLELELAGRLERYHGNRVALLYK